MDDIKVTVGERTRLRRNAIGLTRERLAELIGVSPRFLADVESGKVGVSLATLKRMCTALECTADFSLATIKSVIPTTAACCSTANSIVWT